MQMDFVAASKPVTVHCSARSGTLQEGTEGTITSHPMESLSFHFVDLCWAGVC